MAKSELLSTAAKAADLDKAYSSALKALSVMGIKLALKKPDASKLTPFMAKGDKAEFRLGGDGKMLKVTVECGNLVNALGILDVGKEKDDAKRLVILESLMAAGLISKADYAKEAKAAEAPDPKVAANLKRQIEAEQKKISDAEKKLKAFEAAKTYDAATKIPELEEALLAQAKAEYSTESLDFLDAVAKRKKADALIEEFIKVGSRKEINIPSTMRDQILQDPKKMTLAIDEVKDLLKKDTLPRALKKLKEDLGATTAAAEKKIAELEATQKKLGIS